MSFNALSPAMLVDDRRQGAGAGRRSAVGLCALLLAACAGGGLTPLPPSAPVPAAPSPVVERPTTRTLTLPARLPATTWRVTSSARLRASGGGVPDSEQRVESRALVSWSLSRTPTGALRGTGQVDSFTVRSTLDTVKSAAPTAASAAASTLSGILLLEALIDSATARVTIRPPLANECDRVETAAAALAREVLVRIPDGASEGSTWRDSSVALVCRSGVPMAVYSSTRFTLEQLDDEQLVVRRDLSMRLEGKGGTAFRSLELNGSGTGTHRLDVRRADGTVGRVEGTTTLTLQLRETSPPAPARLQQLVQRVEIRAERASR